MQFCDDKTLTFDSAVGQLTVVVVVHLGGGRGVLSGRTGDRAPRGPTLGPLQRSVTVCLCLRDPPTSGPPLGPLRHSVDLSVRAADRAPRGPTLGPLQRNIIFRLCPGDQAPSGPPLGPLRRPCGSASARRGSGTQPQPPGAPAARCCPSSAPRGSSTQWATTGAPEAHCGKERWSRKGKEPPTKPGWAEPRTTARPPCSVNHLGHHAGAHATRVNHNGAHATREAHATRDHQGTRHAHARPTEWWSAWGGWPVQCVEEWSTWASRAWKRSDAGCGRPEGGGAWAAKPVKRSPQQPAQPRCANYWAPLTHKRHPPHQPHSPDTPTIGLCKHGNNTSRSTGRSGPQNAATPHNMRGEERVTVQGPVKKQQPGEMSHRGLASRKACVQTPHGQPNYIPED